MLGDMAGPATSATEMMARDAARRQMGTGPYAQPVYTGGSGGTVEFSWKHFVVAFMIFAISAAITAYAALVMHGDTADTITLIAGLTAALTGLYIVAVCFMGALVLCLASLKFVFKSKIFWFSLAGGIAALVAVSWLEIYQILPEYAFMGGFALIAAPLLLRKMCKKMGSMALRLMRRKAKPA